MFPSAPENRRPRKVFPLPEGPAGWAEPREMSQLPSPRGSSAPLRVCSLGEKGKNSYPSSQGGGGRPFSFCETLKKLTCTRNS